MATKKNQKKNRELIQQHTKDVQYKTAVQWMEEDANRRLLPKFQH